MQKPGTSRNLLKSDADADAVQVLNLFLALLLSSFGAQKLQSSNNGGGDEAPNKLMEAIDRIRRWSAFAKSRCCPLSPSRRTLVNTSADYPLLDDSHSLPDLGRPAKLCSVAS